MDYFSNMIIKFCQKQEYIDDVLSGNIFMSTLEKHNNTDDSYRGDELDGYRAFSPELYHSARLEWGGVVLPLPIEGMKISYVGMNKIPVFSCVQVDSNMLDEILPNKFRFKKSAIEHMAQFGDYAVFLSKTEMITKIENYANKNNVRVHCGNVRYIQENTPIPEVKSWEELIEQFVFAKTVSDTRKYNLQNEWRIAITYPQVVNDNDKHIVIDIGKMEYAVQIPSIDWLREGTLGIAEL